MNSDLATQKCLPHDANTKAMSSDEAKKLMSQIPGWELDEDSIEKEFKFKDFKEAMEFVNKVADLAEIENHHPGIEISYNEVELELTSHGAGGLTMNDFYMAAKINQL